MRSTRRGGSEPRIAVNVSFADLLDPEFPCEVAAQLVRHDLTPACLILEVTESSILSDAQRIGEVLAEIHRLGIRIALDDFGTGYSSLSHLRALPVGEAKVDASFVGPMQRATA